ncbi:MAG: hypothetical protein WDO71_00475 [Bacteroidota bacterium]
MYSIGKILEEHRTISSLSINGSFASIPFCTQIIADMFNKPVSLRQNSHSVGLGSFFNKCDGAGEFLKAWMKPRRRLNCRITIHRRRKTTLSIPVTSAFLKD